MRKVPPGIQLILGPGAGCGPAVLAAASVTEIVIVGALEQVPIPGAGLATAESWLSSVRAAAKPHPTARDVVAWAAWSF